MIDLVNLEESYSTANKHANKPHNMDKLEDFNGHAKITGPCGTTMEFWLKAQNDKIKKFIYHGRLRSFDCRRLNGNLYGRGEVSLSCQIHQSAGCPHGARRFAKDHEHCALPATNTLKAACDDYLSKGK